MQTEERILMLGTGHATVTHCYNSCFLLSVPGFNLLVDAGGGNGILQQLEKSGTSISDINAIFVTHAHTDHALGVVWLLRMIGEQILNGNYIGHCTIYSHEKVLTLLTVICELSLSADLMALIKNHVDFVSIRENEAICLNNNFAIKPFELQSSEPQFGFIADLPSGKTFVCHGDAPLVENSTKYIQHANWLICEAFCLENHRFIFHPEKIHHATVAETADFAHKCGIENLIIYHTEDSNLTERKQQYISEASQYFTGNIFVPNDLEKINLKTIPNIYF